MQSILDYYNSAKDNVEDITTLQFIRLGLRENPYVMDPSEFLQYYVMTLFKGDPGAIWDSISDILCGFDYNAILTDRDNIYSSFRKKFPIHKGKIKDILTVCEAISECGTWESFVEKYFIRDVFFTLPRVTYNFMISVGVDGIPYKDIWLRILSERFNIPDLEMCRTIQREYKDISLAEIAFILNSRSKK